MMPNQSHANAISVYHAPASPPTTGELVTLQSSVDGLGVKISRMPLVNCDTPNLAAAAKLQDRILDLVISLSQRLEAEIAERRRSTAPSYKVTAVGLMLLGHGPVSSPEERVKLAEQEARAEREQVALAYSFTPDVDTHPIAVGSCDLVIHAGNWGTGDGRRPA